MLPVPPVTQLGGTQHLLIPAYFYPVPQPPPSGWTNWTHMCARIRASNTHGAFIVANPGESGVFTNADPNYRKAISDCRLRGTLSLGYVFTDYHNRAWHEVRRDIDNYYKFYPEIRGIFVDEMSNDPGQSVKDYYRRLYDYVKTKAIQLATTVVGNPGSGAPTDWQMKSTDILVNFEDTYSAFMTWSPPAWVSGYPARRFAHLVHGTPANAAATASACLASEQQNHGGWIDVTTGIHPQAWNQPPDAAMLASRTLHRPQVIAP